jgi:hypothetical protein
VKKYGGIYEEAWGLAQTNDNGFIIAGAHTDYTAFIKSAAIIKLNVNGDSLWQKRNGYSAGRFYGFININDGGFAGWRPFSLGAQFDKIDGRDPVRFTKKNTISAVSPDSCLMVDNTLLVRTTNPSATDLYLYNQIRRWHFIRLSKRHCCNSRLICRHLTMEPTFTGS